MIQKLDFNAFTQNIRPQGRDGLFLIFVQKKKKTVFWFEVSKTKW